jgi:hypothetical protein
MSLINNPDYRLLVEAAGARYCGQDNRVVYFKDPKDDFTMSLYCFALRSPEDVAMAIRSHQNQVRDFPPLEPIET